MLIYDLFILLYICFHRRICTQKHGIAEVIMANKEFSWIINNKFMARKANRTAHSASLFGLSFHMWHRTWASHNILAAKCQYATCTNVLRTQSQTSAMWCRSFCKLTDRAGSCLLCLRRKLIATKLRSWSIAARLTYANVSLITASVTMRKKKWCVWRCACEPRRK